VDGFISSPDRSTPERISLGKTSLQISPLGIGTWQWGDSYWGYGRGGYSDEDLRAGFDESLQAGINFFDSAEVYGRGRSETLLGQFMHSSGQQLVVATKFMPYPWRLSRASLLSHLGDSLRRLGLTSVDLYQIHWPFPPLPVETWAEALADAVQAGLARAVGVSNFNVDQMRRAYAVLERRGIPLASNQVRYNLQDRKVEKNGLLDACRELGITLIAYSPLAQGMLTGKYTPDHPFGGMRAFRLGRYIGPIQPLIARMRTIGQAHGGKSPAQVALNWVMCKHAVPIPGAKNLRQARENAGSLGWALTDDEVAALDAASDQIHL
jgi:aryl-alcohol dehydrogenase-like predicted oxidoreductase